MKRAIVGPGLAVALGLVPLTASAAPRIAKQRPPAWHRAPDAQPATGPGASYYYVSFGQETDMQAAGATVDVGDPVVPPIDSHSLAEIAMESADEQQIIELGWNVDPGVNGDGAPHLFVFHWIDGQGTCYDGCNYVQVSTEHSPAKVLDQVPHSILIEHREDARWWYVVDGDDMGYVPDTEWTGSSTFTHAGLTQWFGEVAAGDEPAPCSDMGNGIPGTQPTAASFSDAFTEAVGVGSAHVPAQLQEIAATVPDQYTQGGVGPAGFRFGGPGAVSTQCGNVPVVDAPPVLPDADDSSSSGGGCCDAGGGGGAGSLALAAMVGAVARRRRLR